MQEKIEREVELDVCINCLKETNYKGARDCKRSDRNKIKDEFNMQEFFTSYQSSFAKMPSGMGADPSKTNYTTDWDQVSQIYRKSQNYRCEKCMVNLQDYKDLLQVHHKNGLKGDNDITNLQALCMLCHAKEHNHMRVSPEKKASICRLRKEQSLS